MKQAVTKSASMKLDADTLLCMLALLIFYLMGVWR